MKLHAWVQGSDRCKKGREKNIDPGKKYPESGLAPTVLHVHIEKMY